MGEREWSREARASTHSRSVHSYREVNTFDAVAGGTSVAEASGSAWSTVCPSAPRTQYLYSAPSPTPGTNNSQTPEDPIDRMGSAVGFQPQKSPITLTPRALGAHTANDVPVTGPPGVSNVRTWAPSTCHRCSWRPSPMRCRSTSPSVGRNRYPSAMTRWCPSG